MVDFTISGVSGTYIFNVNGSLVSRKSKICQLQATIQMSARTYTKNNQVTPQRFLLLQCTLQIDQWTLARLQNGTNLTRVILLLGNFQSKLMEWTCRVSEVVNLPRNRSKHQIQVYKNGIWNNYYKHKINLLKHDNRRSCRL